MPRQTPIAPPEEGRDVTSPNTRTIEQIVDDADEKTSDRLWRSEIVQRLMERRPARR